MQSTMTGGVKAVWFFIGLMMSLPGLLLAFACNWDKDPEVKSDAVKFAVIGFVANIVVVAALACLVTTFLATFATSIFNEFSPWIPSL